MNPQQESELFTSDAKMQPFWWEDAPRPVLQHPDIPNEVDVLVVGSGYTGLHAALETARHGMSTLVLDAQSLGGGCSSLNGGQVSANLKGSYSQLTKKYGKPRSAQLLQEGVNALDFLDHFIQTEALECHWQTGGHFSAAHNPAAYEAIARRLKALPAAVDVEWNMVPREEQRSEIGTDLYHGGVVFPRHGSLHPGLYHLGLLSKVQAAGAKTIGGCAVTKIEPQGNGFIVHTERGVIRAGQVAVATNGYTGSSTPWLQRRVIPIGSYIIATEPLPAAIAHEISPHNRTMTDSRKLVFYYRLSPDKKRMIFGGRVALKETDPTVSAPALYNQMCKIFPQLQGTRVSHSWLGFVGYTFDTLPHIGEQQGMHYAMGYCGSGIALASYCGAIMGNRICAKSDLTTPFTDVAFQTRPLYAGNPWFLKPSILYYKFRDRLNL